MKRLLASIFAAALTVAACTGSAPSTGRSPATGGSPVGGANGDQAVAELCGTGDASLGSIASQLEGMGQTTDASDVSTSIGTAMSNLENAEVDESAQTARGAALTALQQLQAVIQDPAAREQVADQAATALRSLDTQLCV